MVDGAGSKVHIYCMHPGYFLTTFVLGVRRDAPVQQRLIVIEPRFSGLDSAKGVCVTEFGPVEMSWKRAADRSVELLCTVPPAVEGTLRLRAPGIHSKLSIAGSSPLAKRDGDWITATLGPGKHTIHLM